MITSILPDSSANGQATPDRFVFPPLTSTNRSEESTSEILRRLQQQPLQDKHREELKASGLNDKTIEQSCFYSATAADSQRLGFHDSPGMIIAYPGISDYIRFKPDQPRMDDNGRPIKYESLRGSDNHLYVPPSSRRKILPIDGNGIDTIVLTEGEKKALAADQYGFAVISVPGVWGWKGAVALQELSQIPLKGKTVYVAFDSDVTAKVSVKEAISALVEQLESMGATVRVVLLPDSCADGKTGLDDYLKQRGCNAFQQLLSESRDWFNAMLKMIPENLAPQELESYVQPIYRFVKSSGTLAVPNFAKQLRQRLKSLSYEVPVAREFQSMIRKVEPYRPEGIGHENDDDFSTTPDVRYVAEGPTGSFADQTELQGFYRYTTGKEPVQLTNFVLFLTEDVQVINDLEPQRKFSGLLQIAGDEHAFEISAKDYANGPKLVEAIYVTAGSNVIINCKPEELRNAVASGPSPELRKVSGDHGWNESMDAYYFPGGKITRDGFHVAEKNGERVELNHAEFARRLGLCELPESELTNVKRHIVEDLLELCGDHRVGKALLGSVALAILYNSLKGFNRVSLWLVGSSGVGKSHLAKLFQNFFGDFPPAGENNVVSWQSTKNFFQDQGYFFKDALYVVDDFKPEITPVWEATKIVQAYADGATRSRLKRDLTAAKSRPIRGLLLCTAEDIPDHSGSATARVIQIPYPSGRFDTQRARRCREACDKYAGVTAAFITHVLQNKRQEVFCKRVNDLQDRYLEQLQGQENAIRIASNGAMLAAAFEEMATFFQDVWPSAHGERTRFLEVDVPAMILSTATDVLEQKDSQRFIETLAVLLRQGKVRLEGARGQSSANNATAIGRVTTGQRGQRAPVSDGGVYEIITEAALAEVQKFLQDQGRSRIKVTTKTLLKQLRQDGLLLDANGDPLETDGGSSTVQARVAGHNRKLFRIRPCVLTQGWE